MLNLPEDQRLETLDIINATEKFADDQLRRNRNQIFAVNFYSTIQTKVDSLAKSLIKKIGVEKDIDCQRGCNHCCNLRVELLAPEIFLIARKLAKLSKPSLNDITEKLEEQAEYSKNRLMNDYWMPCSLLKDGACSIYDVRPIMCRKLYSLDANICAIRGNEIPEIAEVYTKTGAIHYGAHKAYTKAKFSMESHELSQALVIALKNKNAETDWYNGQQVFVKIPESN